MGYQIKQDDIRLLSQSNKINDISLELLNQSFKTIDTLNGRLISDSYTIDSSSDIRRTYALTLVVSDSSFNIGEDTKIWLNKYIRINIKTLDQITNEYVWYLFGTFLFTDSNYQYDSTTFTLQIQCVDLMSKLTGLRNGQLSGLTTSIPVNTNIREAMISTLTQLGGFEKYNIYDTGQNVPYDLNFSTGATVYDILEKLCTLYSGYEMFFDIDGIFVFQPIPTLIDVDPILVNTDFDNLIISETVQNSFSNIKNVTEIWGQTINSDRYTNNVQYSDNIYTLNFDTSISLSDSINIGFLSPSNNNDNSKIQIKAPSFTSNIYDIVDIDNANIKANKIQNNKAYIMRFINNKATLLGQNQIHAIYKNTNPDSQYNIYKIGEITQVLSGSDYSNIYSDDLAMQRAEYETWLKSHLPDTTTLKLITIPWLDVNEKIEYKSLVNNITNNYIIKSINGSVSDGTMELNMIKYYTLYPYIVLNTTTFNLSLFTYDNTLNKFYSGGIVIGYGTYNSGDEVAIEAKPDSGYVFDKWSDNNTSSVRNIIVTSNTVLTAYFNKV